MLSNPPPLRCFIVEDSPLILRNLTDTLEQVLPLQVVGTAVDEDSATEWIRNHPSGCDLMIIDVFLKTGIGLNVLVAARRHASQARRVVLTNYATDAIRQRCLALDADRVFDKSSELEDLIAYCSELASSTRAA
jgi:DNA-binding NarL/FixJ family response regulator